MRPKLISILVAGAFMPGMVAAQEGEQQPQEWSGSVTVGVRGVGANTNDPSKLNEYRDLSPDGSAQFIGAFELRRRGENDYLNAYGENLGRDDQYLNLSGGRYGSFKYRLYSDELRHNFGSGPGALTPYNGIGSGSLTFITSPVNRNPSTWNTFDHSYRRRDFGGFFELQSLSPWYFRLDANEVERHGVNVFAGAKGTSPGNGFVDLPAPINYTTRNFSGEAGYSTKTGHVAVNLLHSSFDNGNTVLRWQNDYFGGGTGLLDTTVLPPSNDLTRLGINGNLRGLPMDSTLAGRLTHTSLTNDSSMQQNMLSTGATNPATNPSEGSFHGEHKRITAGLSLASRPTQALDTRLYLNYDKLKNDSDEITFNPAVNSGLRSGSTDPRVNCANVAGVVCEPERFHYTKKQGGVEAGYRLSRENKLLGGGEWTHTERERADFPTTREQRYFGEWKNSSIDWVTTRIRYQYLNRHSDFQADESVLAANPMDLYVRRFDLANVHQNLVKLVADLTPAERVDVGFEVIFKRNNYQDTPLGRTSDTRQEYYASVGYGDPKKLRLFAYGDIEYIKYDSNHRADQTNITATTRPDLVDPGSGSFFNPPCTGTQVCVYNWHATNKDTSWQVGLGADWVPRDRLTIKSSLIYVQTEGKADFNVQAATFNTTSGLPFTNINNFDNTRRIAFNVKGIYEMSRRVDLTAGYAYEKYRYSDIGYDNTKYVVGTSNATINNGNSYTTGQFAFQPYSANIVYASAKFKF